MQLSWIFLFCVLLFVDLILLTHAGTFFDKDNYYDDDDYLDELDRSYHNVLKRSSLIYLFRRACIRRGGNCDHRPDECCYNSSCRCNLWGSNCRCQRMGLFQKWG